MKSRDILKQQDKESNLWNILEEKDIFIDIPTSYLPANGQVISVSSDIGKSLKEQLESSPYWNHEK
jgi:hypothetical protein